MSGALYSAGDAPPFRRPGSRASHVPRSGQDRSPASAPDSPARSASASWPVRPARCGWYRAAIRSGIIPRVVAWHPGSPDGRADGPAAKRDASGAFVPWRQVTRRQAPLGSPAARSLPETGLLICARLTRLGGRPRPLQGLARQRHLAWRSEAGGGPDADDLGQAKGGDAVAEASVHVMAGIGQHNAGRNAAATERLKAGWQVSCLPSWPQYCRAAPTECLPCLGKPVSSMIQAWIEPCCSIAGSTRNGPRRAPPHHGSCARKSTRRRGVH